MSRKVLVFGRGGQVGSALAAQAAADPDFVLRAVGRDELDLRRTQCIEPFIIQRQPDWGDKRRGLHRR